MTDMASSVRWVVCALHLLLVLTTLGHAAQPRALIWTHLNTDQQNKDDIPQRCIDNSVTAVSCAGATSPDALLPHPDDCQLFYYCVSPALAPVCRACPAHLHFSPTEHVCDDPQHAGCALSTSTSSTTTTAD